MASFSWGAGQGPTFSHLVFFQSLMSCRSCHPSCCTGWTVAKLGRRELQLALSQSGIPTPAPRDLWKDPRCAVR